MCADARRLADSRPGKNAVEASVEQIEWESSDADKGVFDHYMLKEINEQPEALENALRGRLSDADATAHFGGLNLDVQQLRRADRLILTACGTSYHAALVGEYLFEVRAGCRWKWSTLRSSATAIRRWIAIRLSWRPNRAKRLTSGAAAAAAHRNAKDIRPWRLVQCRRQ